MLEIYLLARFEVRIDGVPVAIPSRQAQSLLAYLLLNLGIPQRRDKIAGMIWPDSPESKARARLRYALWQLRKSLGDGFFLADKSTLAFNTENEFWIDTAVIDGKLIPNLSTQDLKQIVSVYQGDLLPGFYEDWVLLERERLLASFELKMEQYLARLLEEQSWREVLEWGEKWIAMGRAPEPAFRGLIIAHGQLGDTASAASVYRRCVQALEEQLGVEPSNETQKLFEQISRGETPAVRTDRAPRSDEIDIVPDKAPSFMGEGEEFTRRKVEGFVGRVNVLNQLEHHLELACSGQGQVVVIAGDAGRGKTALLRVFRKRAQELHKDLIVAFGQAEAQTGFGDPNLPFRDLLAMLCGDVQAKWESGDVSRHNAQRLWNLVPQVTQALLDKGPDLIDRFVDGRSLVSRGMALAPQGAQWLERLKQYVEMQRQRPEPINVDHRDMQKALFEQYGRVLIATAQENPLLLILDDLQWIDRGSISQLFHLSRRIDGQRIFIVTAYRSGAISQGLDERSHHLQDLITELKRKYGDILIDLDHSEGEGGQQFVDDILDLEPNRFDTEFRNVLFRHTGGHPMFTVELVRQLKSNGDLVQDGKGNWIAGDGIDWEKIPAKVDAVIEGRIGRLPKSMVNLLNIACVEGEEFTAEVLAKISNNSSQEVVQTLSQELDRAHHLVEAKDTRRIGEQRISRYRFQHHLFQKYLLDHLDQVERVQLHEAIGETLEDLYGEARGEIVVPLARHFEEAGITDRAFDYRFEAGERAKRLSANQEALYHFERALGLLETLPDSADKTQKELALHLSRGSTMVAAKGWAAPEVEEVYERAASLSAQVGDTRQLAPALWGLWSFYLTKAKHVLAQEHALRNLALAREEEDPELILVAHWTMGISLTHLGEFNLAREHLQRAVDVYNPKRHSSLTFLFGQNPEITCLTYLAICQAIVGLLDQAQETSNRALSLIEEETHLFSKAFGYALTAVLQAALRDPEGTFENAEQAFRISKEQGFPFIQGLGMMLRGWAQTEKGEAKKGIRWMETGLLAMLATGAELGRSFLQSLLAEALYKRGRFESALEVLNQATESSKRSGDYLIYAELARQEGTIHLELDADQVQADRYYQDAIEIADKQGAKLFKLRAQMESARMARSEAEIRTAVEELRETVLNFSGGAIGNDLEEARKLIEELQV